VSALFVVMHEDAGSCFIIEVSYHTDLLEDLCLSSYLQHLLFAVHCFFILRYFNIQAEAYIAEFYITLLDV